jgi:hypothetical protein
MSVLIFQHAALYQPWYRASSMPRIPSINLFFSYGEPSVSVLSVCGGRAMSLGKKVLSFLLAVCSSELCTSRNRAVRKTGFMETHCKPATLLAVANKAVVTVNEDESHDRNHCVPCGAVLFILRGKYLSSKPVLYQ